MPKKPWRVIETPPVGEPVNNLPVQVSIVVPSTVEQEQIDRETFEKRVEETKRWFDSKFGGDTTTRGVGGYLADDNLIEEPVAVVESSMAIDTYKQHADDIAKFIKSRRQAWQQDTIAYQIEGRLFIYPKKDYIDDDADMTDKLIKVL